MRISRGMIMLLLFCLAGCTAEEKPELPESTGSAEGTETVYLSLATAADYSGTPQGDLLEEQMEILNESGDFDLVLYEGGIMGDDPQLFQAVQEGNLSIVMMSPAVQAQLIPETQLLEIPWLFETNEDYQGFLNQSGIHFLEPYYEKNGLVLLGVSVYDYRYLTSSRAIESMSDLQGLKIRVQDNECHRVLWQALGAEPVTVDFSELYMALYSGMADAQENPYIVIQGKRLYEVQDYIIDTGHLPTIYTYVMNREQWESMAAERQELLRGMFRNYIDEVSGTMQDSIEAVRSELTGERGTTLLTPDESFRAELLSGQLAVVDYIRSQIGEEETELYLSLVDSYKLVMGIR